MDTETIALLPHLQAVLNAVTLVFLAAGYYFIRQGSRKAHIACMLTATLVSTAFMISYLSYHAAVGFLPFTGQGAIRPVYFSILASHVILAAVNVVLVIGTLLLAIFKKFKFHRRLAHWTLPIWAYVSFTGLIVYLLAFHLYPHQL